MIGKLKIGDKVTARLFGGEMVTGNVESIEICKVGEKEGRLVSSCDILKHKNGVICIDCGHWCYFYQIKSIEK